MPVIEIPTSTTPIGMQQSMFVVKSNELVQRSHFNLSTQESKMLLYLISKIKPHDTGHELYEISIGDFCKTCNIYVSSGENYDHAKSALKALADKSVWIQQENGDEILLRWLNRVRLNRRTKQFEISFNEDMLPYLFQLRQRYVQYRLENVLCMKSKHSIRLYEILKSYQHHSKKISLDHEELRTLLAIKGYKQLCDFRHYVVDKAIQEINTISDIAVSYELKKISKGAKLFIFTVTAPTEEEAAERQRRRNRTLIPN